MSTIHKNNFLAIEELIQNTLIELAQVRDYDKVTITDICQKANINRTTFYNHYIDIFDLIDSLDEKKLNELRNQYNNISSNKEDFFNKDSLLILLNFVKNNKSYYRMKLRKDLDFPIGTGFDSFIQKYLIPHCEDKNNQLLIYYENHIKSTITQTLKLWINNQCDISVGDMTEIIYEQFTPFI